ncbi:hypothetical protein ACFC5Z_24845 [Streptomyces sp. NPDC056004]|uniref:hypothetical protein n=1 Tax=Streptomyces sp. NPDC056004 TaxID=3345677 RepID=UPI0035DB91C1
MSTTRASDRLLVARALSRSARLHAHVLQARHAPVCEFGVADLQRGGTLIQRAGHLAQGRFLGAARQGDRFARQQQLADPRARP